MGATAPGTACCNPATLFGSTYLCGSYVKRAAATLAAETSLAAMLKRAPRTEGAPDASPSPPAPFRVRRCSANSTTCATDSACTDRCCAKSFVSDAASQRYCACEFVACWLGVPRKDSCASPAFIITSSHLPRLRSPPLQAHPTKPAWARLTLAPGAARQPPALLCRPRCTRGRSSAASVLKIRQPAPVQIVRPRAAARSWPGTCFWRGTVAARLTAPTWAPSTPAPPAATAPLRGVRRTCVART